MTASVNLAALALVPMAWLAAQSPSAVGSPPQPNRQLQVLGKMLFWEEQLSSDDSMACGTCHRPSAGGADARPQTALHPGADGVLGTADDVHGSIGPVRTLANGDFAPDAVFGLRQQVTRRRAPSVIDSAHATMLHWDGAVDDRFVDPLTGLTVLSSGAALEQQALLPLLAPDEMGHVGRTWHHVCDKLATAQPMRLASALPRDLTVALQQSPDYPSLFAAAFGDPAITPTRIARAIGAYERTLRADATPWDRFAAGDPNALDRAQLQGWRLFSGAAGCTNCHPAPAFTDDAFHALGLRPAFEDLGRAGVDPSAVPGAFRTPSLRNAGLRARLFHNGQSPPLDAASLSRSRDSALMVHWLGGGGFAATPDPLLWPLQQRGVTLSEMQLVFEFVRTALTDERVATGTAPFDHPTLRSARESMPRLFGDALPGSSEPFLIDWVPPYPGNSAFRLGLVGSSPGSIAALAIGFQSHEPTVWAYGLPWHLAPVAWQTFLLQGAPGEPGHTTWHVPLPDIPALASIPLYYQLLVDDAATPGGLAVSRGSQFFLR